MMNATERARRSDSLYYDTQVTNRRALCDMIANLESDLAESKAENKRLRELVRDMWDFYCVVPDEPYTSKEELDFSVEVWSRMRELGIEV